MRIKEKAQEIMNLAKSHPDFYESEVMVFIRRSSGEKSIFIRLQSSLLPDGSEHRDETHEETSDIDWF
nr:hypothetical protein [uncultured Halomonas sp.]